MKIIMCFLALLFVGNILIGSDLTKEEFIKTFKARKIFYHQNKKNNEEKVSIDVDSILSNEELKNFVLFDKLTYFSIHTPKNITNKGLVYLCEIKTFKTVKLSGGNISDETLQILEKSSELKAFSISGNQINGSGLKYIADKKNIYLLDLGTCSITDEGIKNISGLINLEYLALYRTKVTDEGIKHLVNLKKLKKLELDETNITDKSVPYIIEMMGNKQDKYDTYLIIYRTKISRNGVKKLLDAGIKVNCDYKDLSSEIPWDV